MKLGTVRDRRHAYSHSNIRRSPVEVISPATAAPVPPEPSGQRAWMKYERAQRIVGRSRFLRRLTIGAYARFELFLSSNAARAQGVVLH